jgi:hypothetical protein
MATKTSAASLRKAALELADVTEGVACEGTVLESRTVKVGNKAFAFIREKEARLKLSDSLDEAKRHATQHPDDCEVGATGWVKCSVGAATSPSAAVMKRWLKESHALMSAPAKKKRR